MQAEKKYLEQIFNFAFGMLKSLARANLSGMSSKNDLKYILKLYILYKKLCTFFFLHGETQIGVLGDGKLVVPEACGLSHSLESGVHLPPPCPPIPSTGRFREEILSPPRILGNCRHSNPYSLLRDTQHVQGEVTSEFLLGS